MNAIHSFNIRSRCGFCELGGHNITRCNDHRIPEILNTSQMYLHSIIDDPDRIINYRNYLTNAPMTTIKLLANRNSIPSINSRREIITILLRRATETPPTTVPTNRVLFPTTPPTTPPPNVRRILLSPEPINEYRRNRRPGTILSIMDEEFIALPPLPLDFPIYEDEVQKTIVVFYSLMDNTIEKTDCPICFNPMEYHNQTTTNCNHKFCCDCVKEIISRKKPIMEDDECQTIKCNVINCPLCRTEINELSTLDNAGLVKKILKL